MHCELTDEAITIDQAHLDHAYPTFGVMVVMFRAAQGWHEQIPVGVLTPSQDMQTTTTFADPAIAAKFRVSHNRGARLRMIKTKANLVARREAAACRRSGGRSQSRGQERDRGPSELCSPGAESRHRTADPQPGRLVSHPRMQGALSSAGAGLHREGQPQRTTPNISWRGGTGA